jgi:hypothetical protein
MERQSRSRRRRGFAFGGVDASAARDGGGGARNLAHEERVLVGLAHVPTAQEDGVADRDHLAGADDAAGERVVRRLVRVPWTELDFE